MDTVNLHETIKSDVMIMSNTEDNEIDTFAKGLPALTRIREINQQMNPLYYTHCQHYFLHYRRCCRCTLNLHAAPLNILKYD